MPHPALLRGRGMCPSCGLATALFEGPGGPAPQVFTSAGSTAGAAGTRRAAAARGPGERRARPPPPTRSGSSPGAWRPWPVGPTRADSALDGPVEVRPGGRTPAGELVEVDRLVRAGRSLVELGYRQPALAEVPAELGHDLLTVGVPGTYPRLVHVAVSSVSRFHAPPRSGTPSSARKQPSAYAARRMGQRSGGGQRARGARPPRCRAGPAAGTAIEPFAVTAGAGR